MTRSAAPTAALIPRSCPVCHGAEKRVLFRQEFGSLSEGSLMRGYDVAVCAACGCGYADDIPDQADFDRYYSEMSKYEYADNAGMLSETGLQRFREVADLVGPHLRTSHHLLDVGCATGGLLAEFKRRGFSDLMGVDPSTACASMVEKLYGIPSRQSNISDLHTIGKRFDAIFLTGVLEHLREVDSSIEQLKTCLKPGGLVYFEVPDASRYDEHFSAPYQFFSMEHINFFGPKSLSRLLARHGFASVLSARLIRHLSPTAIEPTIGGLFRLEPETSEGVAADRDDETEPALCRYIEQSAALEQRIRRKVAALADAGRPLAVWGTGTHTLRLMETSRLPDARIVAFIDSNPNYQGKTLAGIPVVAPSAFAGSDAEILISSQTAEEEIFGLITQKLGWSNSVHRLYSTQ